MSRFLNYFFRGLIVVAPVAVTVYVCVALFQWIDQWLGFRIPGVGFVLTIALITLVGFLASSLIARGLLGAVERTMERLPFVRLLYGSTRDLLNAFVGEKRRFTKPVLVTLLPGSRTRVFGFLTQETLSGVAEGGLVTVYVPQSYGFAGQLLVVPAEQVEMLSADSADVMAFVISGGVTQMDRFTPAAGAAIPPRVAEPSR
ncbi:MAG TPA: DUF502 domain-containing protein [Gemmatimonadaceae bacterium]|nr:DUF502 domain-containing protein [Gemmatimonadaceae bacterium]